MNTETICNSIQSGRTALGIELGSTRIKAVLVDEKNQPVASGSYGWENKLEKGVWTYSLDDIWTGLTACYQDLKENVKQEYGITLTTFGAIGFSAMMHGYMAFDENEKLLVPFRTWRNTITERASKELSELFHYHIPQRWSIAHLYQSILEQQEHVADITYFSTLAGYIHWQLTGEKVLGIDDASGMFPIDPDTQDYRQDMLEKFRQLDKVKEFKWDIADILPKVLVAGEVAGHLTEKGARILDPSGDLQAGIPVCPPEGDAGTGMIATNSIAVNTGNISAGTSGFVMAVLEKELSKPYEEIDMVTTPDGKLVAMVHGNNCTSDLNAWVGLFKEYSDALGLSLDMNTIYATLYTKALEGEKDGGGLLAYNYVSGEHITGFAEGRPLFARTPNSNFTLANLMRTHLMASIAALKSGMDILYAENVEVKKINGHGGLYKTAGVGQKITAAMFNRPVCCMTTAGEGGAWGIALLASYMIQKKEGQVLPDYLNESVFDADTGTTIDPDPEDVAGAEAFLKRYMAGFPVEQAAIDCMPL